MPGRVAILQSNYIPWRGYFDILGSVDAFVLYDNVQYTKNDWRNRNRIKAPGGAHWLTIPVKTSGQFGQTIAETRVANSHWPEKHWRSLAQCYGRAPYFDLYRERLEAAYQACRRLEYLSDVNRLLIDVVAEALQLRTSITSSARFPAVGDRNARLIQICRSLGADIYVSGPSARSYLDLEAFKAAGVTVEFMDYSQYAPYPQLHGPFESHVSILDLLLNVGPRATNYMTIGGLTGTPDEAVPPSGRS